MTYFSVVRRRRSRFDSQIVTAICDEVSTVPTWCIHHGVECLGMSIGQAFLGLLESQPRHGYDLKRAYDEQFTRGRPLHYGQVYATLSRLLKNGLVEVDSVEPGEGP